MIKFKTIAPLLMASAVLVGSALVYAPNDANAMPHTQIDQERFLEEVFTPKS